MTGNLFQTELVLLLLIDVFGFDVNDITMLLSHSHEGTKKKHVSLNVMMSVRPSLKI